MCDYATGAILHSIHSRIQRTRLATCEIQNALRCTSLAIFDSQDAIHRNDQMIRSISKSLVGASAHPLPVPLSGTGGLSRPHAKAEYSTLYRFRAASANGGPTAACKLTIPQAVSARMDD